MTTENASSQPSTPDAGVQQPADSTVLDTTSVDDVKSDAPEAETKVDAPEVVYEFKAPDGVELAKDDTEAFVALAKEAKLPADMAQKIVDLAVKREVARGEAFVAQVKGWEDAVKTDKELGGDKLPETLATARKAIDLGPPELKDLLSSTKMGSHPAVVKWAYAVGKALSEDRFVPGSPSPSSDASTAKSLYPNQS